MNVPTELILGGITVPFAARHGLQCDYAAIGGASVLRLSDGTGVKRQRWEKTRVDISAEGNVPPGLEGLDYGGPLTLACPAPRQMGGSGLVYTLPAARRADAGYTPTGQAERADGLWQPTALALAGDIATLTAVPGATAYRVLWYPLLSVLLPRPPQALDLNDGIYRWSLEAEEV